MRLITLLFTVFILFDIHGKLAAQDTSKVVNRNDTATSISNSDTTNLINQLENETNGAKTVYARATFKSTRVINGHSVENLPAHVLDVRISHRFGPLSGG